MTLWDGWNSYTSSSNGTPRANSTPTRALEIHLVRCFYREWEIFEVKLHQLMAQICWISMGPQRASLATPPLCTYAMQVSLEHERPRRAGAGLFWDAGRLWGTGHSWALTSCQSYTIRFCTETIEVWCVHDSQRKVDEETRGKMKT